MMVEWQEQLRSGVGLRAIVSEATIALISMDAERLEELARCCTELNRDGWNVSDHDGTRHDGAQHNGAQYDGVRADPERDTPGVNRPRGFRQAASNSGLFASTIDRGEVTGHAEACSGLVALQSDIQSHEIWDQMAVDLGMLDRVLFETRANLEVLSRLHAIRLREMGMLGPSVSQMTRHGSIRNWPETEDGYGDD